MADTASLLATRYGGGRPRRSRRFWWIVAAVGIGLGIVAVAAMVLAQPGAHIEYSAPRYVSSGDDRVDVSVTVTMTPGSTARCAVQVLGTGQSTVGWRYVDVQASQEYTQTVVVPVLAVQPPIAATVPQCWVTNG